MTTPFREGEVYVCPKADCGFELTVAKAAPPEYTDQPALSCCGKTMVKKAG
jgi:hypothetical protein